MKNFFSLGFSGITLIELLIGLLLTGLVFAAGTSLYVSSLQMVTKESQVAVNVDQSTEVGMERFVRDLQTATLVLYVEPFPWIIVQRDCNCAEVPNGTPWDIQDDNTWIYSLFPMWGQSGDLRKSSCNGGWPDATSTALATKIRNPFWSGYSMFSAASGRAPLRLELYPTNGSGQKRVITSYTPQLVHDICSDNGSSCGEIFW